MKQIYSKLLVVTILFACVFSFCNAGAQSWEQLGNQGFSSGRGYYTSLAIAGGVQYVVYQDYANGFKATVMSNAGSGWAVVGTAGFTPNQVAFTSIAIDTFGTPYVVYSDNEIPHQASVMKYYGGSWVNVGPPNFTTANVSCTDIAIDHHGTPYVVYVDGSNYYKATVKKYDAITNSWLTVGGGGFSKWESKYTTIAISRNNTPYVAYQDLDTDSHATVMAFDGLNWYPVGSYGFSSAAVFSTDIALDTNSVPYVVFSDNAHGRKATVMKYNGTSWVNLGNAGFSDSMAECTTIAVGKSGVPYVAYSEGGILDSGGQATVMEYNGASWEPVCHNKISAGRAWYTSVAVDSYSTPYVAYMDYPVGGKVSVLVDNSSGPCYPAAVKNTVAANELSIYPNPASTELTIAASTNITSLVISSLTGQTVYQSRPGAERLQINISGLPAGMYFIRVNDTEVRKFVKE